MHEGPLKLLADYFEIGIDGTLDLENVELPSHKCINPNTCQCMTFMRFMTIFCSAIMLRHSITQRNT